MRKARWAAIALLSWGCGANPLLKMAAADYAPYRVGSNWHYVTLAGATAFNTLVVSGATQNGRGAFNISSYAGIPGTTLVAASGDSVDYFSAGGWVVDRKLPYVTLNSWFLPSGLAQVTIERKVDGTENVVVPAGTFVRCFRLKTTTSTYDAVADTTATTGTYIWVAPDVGDVQYASIDAAGTVAVTAQLGSYSLGH